MTTKRTTTAAQERPARRGYNVNMTIQIRGVVEFANAGRYPELARDLVEILNDNAAQGAILDCIQNYGPDSAAGDWPDFTVEFELGPAFHATTTAATEDA